jgi:hypothetical protein
MARGAHRHDVDRLIREVDAAYDKGDEPRATFD